MRLYKGDTFSVSIYDMPSPIEKFAASELAKYLKLAGLTCSESSKLKFCLKKNTGLGSEGLYIKISKNEISFSGNGAGALYSVYEFLERYMGFCFGAYSEIIPNTDCCDLPETEYTKEHADLPYRTAIVQFGVWAGDADRALTLPFIDWLAKNRYNRILTWVSVYETLKDNGMMPELEKRGIKLSVGHHQSAFTFLPPYGNKYFHEKYLETHPEYYRLEKNGERFLPKDYGGQLIFCCRNEDCINQVCKNAVQWLKDNPTVDTLAFWPNDHSSDACCCEKCSKHTKTENYLYFENRLAEKIALQLPDIKIDVLIYNDLWECPEKIRLCDNIIIDQATWSANGLRRCGAPDGSGIIGTEYDANLLKYKRICKNTVFYDYYMGNYNARQRLLPACDEMQSIFKFFVKSGISGSGTQVECFNLWNNLLNFFAFARTGYDTSLGFEDILLRFSTLFGDGKEQIKEIMRMVESVCDGQDSIRNMGAYTVMNTDTEKIYRLFDKALEKESGVFAYNIKMLRLSFRYSELITKDQTKDSTREPQPASYSDPTGELAYMSYAFDSYHNMESKYGIALPVKNKSNIRPDSIWYNI